MPNTVGQGMTRGRGPDTLWVVRHGQSTANVAFAAAAAESEDAGLDGRDADVSLSPLGHRQARALGLWLSTLASDQVPDVVYSSPYLRARQTAHAALAAMGHAGHPVPQVRWDHRLRDREMGVLELLTPAAIADRFPREAQERRRVGDLVYRPPGGESLLDVASRLRGFLRDLTEANDGNRVVVVAHDATALMLRGITEDLTEQDIEKIMAREPVANASLNRWERRGGRLPLVDYNRTDHLSDQPRG